MSFKFERLLVWQRAMDLSQRVSLLVKGFPKEELFILVSQLKRAADSVALNIAEGSTGQTDKEFIRFLKIALRSDVEVVCGLHIARQRGFIIDSDFKEVYTLCEEILVMINGLIRKLSSNIQSND